MQMYWEAFLTSMHYSYWYCTSFLRTDAPTYRVSGIVRNLKKLFFLHKRITRCSNRFCWNAVVSSQFYFLIYKGIPEKGIFLLRFLFQQCWIQTWHLSIQLMKETVTSRQKIPCYHLENEKNLLSNNIPIGYISW